MAKTAINHGKRKMTNLEKIFVTCITDKGLISFQYLFKIRELKGHLPHRRMIKRNGHTFQEKEMQIILKHEKMLNLVGNKNASKVPQGFHFSPMKLVKSKTLTTY